MPIYPRAGALLLAAAVGAQAPVAPSAAELAVKIQAHYATVRDLSADFTLTQTSELIKKAATDRGTVSIKKPNRMRWVFDTGSKNVVVSDGTRMYSYFPQDRYVQQASVPTGDDAPTALLFLAGRTDLTRDFTSSLPGDQVADEWHVTFTPENPRAEFRTLTLEVDRRTFELRGFVAVDDQGTSQHFRLQHLKENAGIADSTFAFTIPKGVEVR